MRRAPHAATEKIVLKVALIVRGFPRKLVGYIRIPQFDAKTSCTSNSLKVAKHATQLQRLVMIRRLSPLRSRTTCSQPSFGSSLIQSWRRSKTPSLIWFSARSCPQDNLHRLFPIRRSTKLASPWQLPLTSFRSRPLFLSGKCTIPR